MTALTGHSTPDQVLGTVRRLRRRHSPKTTIDRMTDVYLGLFLAVYAVSAVAWIFDVDLSGTSFSFHDTVAWMPVVLFLAMWSVIRYGTWQGPVVFGTPEMQWIVTSPLDRRRLVLIRLRRAFVAAVVVGLAGGLVVTLVAATMTDVARLGVFAGSAVSIGAVVLLAVALSWHTERSPRLSGLVNLLSPVALGFGALLALGVAMGYETLVYWSGPWGWASAFAVSSSGGTLVGGWILAALLLTACIVASASAVLTATRIPDEELWRRAEARSSASAAMFFGDVRTLKSISRRNRARGHVRGRQFRIAHPARPWLVVVSWDVLTLRRDPSRAVAAAIFVVGGFAAGVAATGRSIFGVVSFLFLYAAASRLVEPIRVEVAQPDAHRMLPWRWGTILGFHCLVPVALLSIFSWLGLVVVAIGGFASVTQVVVLAVAAPFVSGALVGPAAIAAARQPFPVGTMIGGGDAGPVLALLWLLVGPALAAVVLSISLGGLQSALDGNAAGLVTALVVLGGGTAGFMAWLVRRPSPTK